jgi:hypothetical protein
MRPFRIAVIHRPAIEVSFAVTMCRIPIEYRSSRALHRNFARLSGLVDHGFVPSTTRKIMKNAILVAAVFLSAASLQAVAQTATDGDTPAVTSPDTKNATAPVEGANSFTEAQAKDRIAEAGYTDVSALKLDDQGVWRGTAIKDGKSTPVGLDYQGNVVTQ